MPDWRVRGDGEVSIAIADSKRDGQAYKYSIYTFRGVYARDPSASSFLLPATFFHPGRHDTI